jgi:hypothetical protein
MTNDQIAAECERAFQAGGPRVFTFNPERSTFRPSALSAKRTAELAESDHAVWARRKDAGLYVWKCVSAPKPKRQGLADILRTALADRRHLAPDNMAENELLDAIGMARDLIELVKEARKIIRASSSRHLAKDWDQRATEALGDAA